MYQKWQKFSQTKTSYTVQSDSHDLNKISTEKLSDLKLVLKDCEWTKKELEPIFSPNQFYSI